MSFLKKLFKKKEEEKSIETYQDFWDWFITKEQNFHKVVKEGDSDFIANNFFDIIGPKLDELKEDIRYLTGMLDDNTADLILTVDGDVSKFYIVEELVVASPKLPNWKFRAHKPSNIGDSFGLSMYDYNFDTENISFYSNDDKEYPDEINITIVHNDYTEENADEIKNGCFLFLENYLGELHFATMIDGVDFASKENAEKELVPFSKLNDFLVWREKEFIEKYEGTRYNTNSDSYSLLEATLKSGNPLIATINTDLLEWDAKASHPWILEVIFEFEGKENGFPEKEDLSTMNTFEDEIMEELKDFEGYLNIGRETANNKRYIYFACKDYRKPCKIVDGFIKKYQDKITVFQECYKDKYWRSLERFRKTI